MQLAALLAKAEARAERRRHDRLGVDVDPEEIREHLRARYGFGRPVDAGVVAQDVDEMLERWTEHATNPMHMGLFRPAPDPLCLAADVLAAVHDPNLATWDFAPAANEIERFVLAAIASRFGWPAEAGLHHFTSGGQESNHTAVITALTKAFPDLPGGGLRALPGRPVFYVSVEGHNSFDKIAHATGLGREAVRRIPVDEDLRMDVGQLGSRIEQDRCEGALPFLVVATAGTTAAGIIDPLPQLASLAAEQQLWLHVDAAWGGAAALSARLRSALAGIERADSITCDAHKWFATTAGAGMAFVRHREPVERAFGVSTSYVPDQAKDGRVYPFITSLQWSRRFIGLRLFLILAAHGWEGLEKRIDRQANVADHLRNRLVAAGFHLLNRTPLPVVCFTHSTLADRGAHAALVTRLKREQSAWISHALLGGRTPALRACITSYETTPADVDTLVGVVQRAIREVAPAFGQGVDR